MSDKFLRLPEVKERVGIGRSLIYRKIGEKTFPSPIKIGRASAWPESAIDAWVEQTKRAANG